MDTNSHLMSFSELSHSIGARHISFSREMGFSSVSIDSRNVKTGALFVALNGNSSDGHNYVESAFNAGAAAVMIEASKLKSFNIENIAQKKGKDIIITDNTLKGFQDSARVYLEKFPSLLKIGITGSNGKTTTKEITGSIVSCEKNTIINKGNLNSETGLALSAFEVCSNHEVCVFEMGMNRKNEIAELASILKPNIALITNIGSSHIGILGTKDAIAEEKKNIFLFLTENDTALIPQDTQYRDYLIQGVKGKVSFYGKDNIKEIDSINDLGLAGSEISYAGEKISFALPGKHNIENAIAAIAIAKELSVSAKAIKNGLEKTRALFGRSEIIEGQVTVVRDCYNASPESMAKSIEFCDSLNWTGRRVYILADMMELGNKSASEHEKIGSLLCESKADMIFLFGKEMTTAADNMKNNKKLYFHTLDMKELSVELERYLKAGDLVLLKGSRACALEQLDNVINKFIKNNELEVANAS